MKNGGGIWLPPMLFAMLSPWPYARIECLVKILYNPFCLRFCHEVSFTLRHSPLHLLWRNHNHEQNGGLFRPDWTRTPLISFAVFTISFFLSPLISELPCFGFSMRINCLVTVILDCQSILQTFLFSMWIYLHPIGSPRWRHVWISSLLTGLSLQVGTPFYIDGLFLYPSFSSIKMPDYGGTY